MTTGRERHHQKTGERRGGRPDPRREYLGVAVTVLGVPPVHFWAMTPMEFQSSLDAYIETLAGQNAVGRPPSRDEVADLMARFPD